MSKAFTKETDDSPEDDLEPESSLPQGFKNYMTPSGAQRLRDELKKLIYTDRPEVVKTVSWAASNGDRSENGDYIYGKRRLREIDRRIRFLTKRLDQAEVVETAGRVSDRVLFGAMVTVDNEDGVRKTYQIVGIDETDVKNGRISWISPLAKALLNSKVGDLVQFRSPQGESELEVIEIRY